MELDRLIYNYKKEIAQPGFKIYHKIVLKPYRIATKVGKQNSEIQSSETHVYIRI